MDKTDRIFSPVTVKHFNGPTQIALAMKERKKKLWNLLISAGIEFLIYVHMNALDNHQVRFNARNEINAKRNLTQRLSLLHLKLKEEKKNCKATIRFAIS